MGPHAGSVASRPGVGDRLPAIFRRPLDGIAPHAPSPRPGRAGRSAPRLRAGGGAGRAGDRDGLHPRSGASLRAHGRSRLARVAGAELPGIRGARPEPRAAARHRLRLPAPLPALRAAAHARRGAGPTGAGAARPRASVRRRSRRGATRRGATRSTSRASSPAWSRSTRLTVTEFRHRRAGPGLRPRPGPHRRRARGRGARRLARVERPGAPRAVCADRDDVDCIRRGFLPDPQETAGEAGGPVDVRLLGAWVPRLRDAGGRSPPAPAQRLRLLPHPARPRRRHPPRSWCARPGGRYLCSSPDDADAFLDRDAWPAGSSTTSGSGAGSRTPRPPTPSATRRRAAARGPSAAAAAVAPAPATTTERRLDAGAPRVPSLRLPFSTETRDPPGQM